jgi:hypothetical protein
MKIMPPHLAEMQRRAENALKASGFESWQAWINACCTPESVKDKQLWFRWCIYSQKIIDHDFDFQDELYKYLNDTHITTALKYIIPLEIDHDR